MSAIQVVGVDVSKAHLDVALRAKSGAFRHRRFENARHGVQALEKLIGKKPTLVVAEATGPYSVLLHELLTERGFSVSIVNPAQVRALAKARGQHAKTDAIDAELLVEFGEVMSPAATPLRSIELRTLDASVLARKQLMDQLTKLQNQRENASSLLDAGPFDAVEGALQEAIADVERRIRQIVKGPEFAHLLQMLCAQPGIGQVVATTIITELPELGHVDDKQIASLVGLAPYTHQSGTLRARGRTRGGRANLRRTIFMGGLVAVQHDDRLRAFYERLVKAGKPKMVALIAATRKLLTWLNARARALLRGTGVSEAAAST